MKKQQSSDESTISTVPMNELSFNSNFSCNEDLDSLELNHSNRKFAWFRRNYLIVHIAIMLADGLQGTHLYVLYEGYNFNVATLYATGFAAGALASPFMGPLVDRIGRRKSAIYYCLLEIMINLLEQYECLTGLILARIVGGITTNLLFTVFESWLVTEHRKKGFSEEKLEIIMRDSVISSNISAIASGYLAHQLAHYLGAVGPFEGAVFFTFIALVLVTSQWTENYGSDSTEIKTVGKYMKEAFSTISGDRNIMKIGLIQGLSEGCLMTFVFLWSPALSQFASKIPDNGTTYMLGLDTNKEPAYGLIFGGFMACGALGGFLKPRLRTALHRFLSRQWSESREPLDESSSSSTCSESSISDYGESSFGENTKPVIELLASLCYFFAALLISVPFFVRNWESSFLVSLCSFFIYEFFIGVYMPCEGIIRSIYMPNDSICSLMTMLRVIVNVAVALGVVSTNFIAVEKVFLLLSLALLSAAALQLSLVDEVEWFKLKRSIYNTLVSLDCVSSGGKAELAALKKFDCANQVTNEDEIIDKQETLISSICLPNKESSANTAHTLNSEYSVLKDVLRRRTNISPHVSTDQLTDKCKKDR